MVKGIKASLFFVRRAGFSETPRPPLSFLQKITCIFNLLLLSTSFSRSFSVRRKKRFNFLW